jgi:hypothetical protein
MFPQVAWGHYLPDVAISILIDIDNWNKRRDRSIVKHYAVMHNLRWRVRELKETDFTWLLVVPIDLREPAQWIGRQDVPARYWRLRCTTTGQEITILRPFPNNEFCLIAARCDQQPPLPPFAIDRKELTYDYVMQTQSILGSRCLVTGSKELRKRLRDARATRARLQGPKPA